MLYRQGLDIQKVQERSQVLVFNFKKIPARLDVGLFQMQQSFFCMDLLKNVHSVNKCNEDKPNEPLSLELDSSSLALSSSFSRTWILSFSSATLLSVAPFISCNLSSRALLAMVEGVNRAIASEYQQLETTLAVKPQS